MVAILGLCGTAAIILGGLIAFLLSNEHRITVVEQANRDMERRVEVLEAKAL